MDFKKLQSGEELTMTHTNISMTRTATGQTEY